MASRLGQAPAELGYPAAMLTYVQAIVLGLLQGVTELFPVSSLGHSVILPQLLGWSDVVAAQSASESYFLAFLVGLHVATALALLVFYRSTWARILRGLLASARTRRIETPDQRLGWLLVVATIPAGFVGLLLEHMLRVVFARPLAAAGFLLVNGLVLLFGEWVRRRAEVRAVVAAHAVNQAGDRRLDTLEFREAAAVGVAQVFALLPGISRSGITMVTGLARGLDHEDAANFSFLLATPIILAAGLYKLPDLLGPNGDGVRPQILVGSLAAALAAYLSVRFLTRWFATRTLLPFAAYSLVAGALAIARFL
jgi:undecaprenyl-diphosphatase